MFGQGEISKEEIELIRRSLAMAPSLPGDSAKRLLEEIQRLREERRLTAEALEAIVARLRGG